MNKQALSGQREYFKMVHGVTLRLIGTFTDEELDFRPRPEMRSVRDLILHIYGAEKAMTEGALAGKVTDAEENKGLPETEEAKPILAGLKTIADVQDYARRCHKAADEALAAITDEQLARPVESPFGTFLGWQFFNFCYDEHWHHRGQLYTYARLLGKEPPMLYDYENSPA
ncbi:MAG: DinB family protein [Acidobacteria bacterium]|nr:DinB family protein [Acidobacteriota bacterium]